MHDPLPWLIVATIALLSALFTWPTGFGSRLLGLAGDLLVSSPIKHLTEADGPSKWDRLFEFFKSPKEVFTFVATLVGLISGVLSIIQFFQGDA